MDQTPVRRNKYRKNAILEIERSSWGEREEANIERRTAGVTGILLFSSTGGGCWNCLYTGLAVEEVEVEDDIALFR